MSLDPTTFAQWLNEGSTAIYTAVLKDEAGTVIPANAIDALTLTLTNVADGAIINERDEQDALNDNNVTVHPTSGLLTYALQSEDTAIQDDGLPYETHRATFQCTFEGKQANWDVDFMIRNLSAIPRPEVEP